MATPHKQAAPACATHQYVLAAGTLLTEAATGKVLRRRLFVMDTTTAVTYVPLPRKTVFVLAVGSSLKDATAG